MTVQSSNLSSLSPKLMVYNSSLGLVGQALAANSMGATVSVSTSVASGQGYYIKVLAAPGYGAIGGYGLLVNLGSQTQAPIPPPNTVVAQQPDQGGGSLTNGISIVGPDSPASPPAPGAVYTTIGTLSGWAVVYTAAPSASPVTPVSPESPAPVAASPAPIAPAITVSVPSSSPVSVGTITAKKHHPPRWRIGRCRRSPSGTGISSSTTG